MTNLFSFVIVIAVGFLFYKMISRRNEERAQKELRQKEIFFKETQSIISTISQNKPKSTPTINNSKFLELTVEYFKSQGYTVTESTKTDGIDLIGIKDNVLALVRCDNIAKEIDSNHLKEFILNCTIYADTHPILNSRKINRYYATQKAVKEDALNFVRSHPNTISLLEI